MKKDRNGFPVLTTIDAGVGTIRYQTNNFDLENIMEAIGEKIKRDGYKSVMELLERN